MRQIREQRRLAELCRGQTPALVTGRRLPPPPGELDSSRLGDGGAGGEERAAATAQQLSIKIESLRVVIHGAVLVKRQGGRKEFKTQVQDISSPHDSSGVSQFKTEFQNDGRPGADTSHKHQLKRLIKGSRAMPHIVLSPGPTIMAPTNASQMAGRRVGMT